MAKEIKMNPDGGGKQAKGPELQHTIGFGKGVRAGNFRLYKIKASVGAKQHIDSIVISNLGQSWKVQVPSTTAMYSWIEILYNDYANGKVDGLNMTLSNMMNVSLTPRADYHFLVNCIAQVFADPNGSFKKDGRDITIVDAVCNDIRWIAETLQEQYKEDQTAEESSDETEKQLKYDETCHSMLDEMETLKEEEKGSNGETE